MTKVRELNINSDLNTALNEGIFILFKQVGIDISPKFQSDNQIKGILKLVKKYHLTGHFYKVVTRSNHPKLLPALEKEHDKFLARNFKLSLEFDRVTEAIRSNDLKVIALKGIYHARRLYDSLNARAIYDIDLLVKPEDLEKIIQILSAIGYFPEKNWKKWIKFLPEITLKNSGSGIELDIHTSLTPLGRFDFDTDFLWQSSLANENYRVMEDTLDFIYTLIHTNLHYILSSPGYMIDINRMLKLYDIDWEKFFNTVKRFRCQAPVYNTLYFYIKSFNTEFPDRVYMELKKRKFNILLTKLVFSLFGIRKRYIFNNRLFQIIFTLPNTHPVNLIRYIIIRVRRLIFQLSSSL